LASKPTYEELEQRVEKLETQAGWERKERNSTDSKTWLLKALLDNLNVGVFMVEAPSGRPILANHHAINLLGRGILNGAEKNTLATAYKAYRHGTGDYYPESEMPIVRGLQGEYTSADDMVVVHPDGRRVLLEVFGCPVKDDQGNVTASLATFSDITAKKKAEEEHKKLQAQLVQAQKMESVGRLAGGVAHDFNNMLGVIIGHAEMAMQQMDPALQVHADLTEIKKAAKRSADLTRQLLAFARRQTAAPIILELNRTIAGMLKMFRRLIGEDIDLAWLPGADLWSVKMDPSQIDQILANLCVNARDAIDGVGRITIETHNVAAGEISRADFPDLPPGNYVMLAVSDDGAGMDRKTRQNLFEPFYTTKKVGKGTGLGLSTVYGIVKQNQGHISVNSEPGKGATFKIYFPRTEEIDTVKAEPAVESIVEGTETVLLVEDEGAILRMGKAMLESFGYTVLAADRPDEALAIVDQHDGPMHLLITDVVMPDMNGKELMAKIRKHQPKIKVLFISGYTEDVIMHRGILQQNVNFLQKPFTVDSLARKVREALDKPI